MDHPWTIVAVIVVAIVVLLGVWSFLSGVSDLGNGFPGGPLQGLGLALLGVVLLIGIVAILLGGKIGGGYGDFWGEIRGPRRRR